MNYCFREKDINCTIGNNSKNMIKRKQEINVLKNKDKMINYTESVQNNCSGN